MSSGLDKATVKRYNEFQMRESTEMKLYSSDESIFTQF